MSKANEDLTPEELQAKEEAKRRRLANLKTFRPYSELTPEELQWQKEQTAKGGKARGEQAKAVKNLREVGKVILDTRISRSQAEKILGESAELLLDEDLTVSAVLMLSAVREGIENGNIKALEFLRDTTGQKVRDGVEVEISGNIITDSERRLLEKFQNRQKSV